VWWRFGVGMWLGARAAVMAHNGFQAEAAGRGAAEIV
jgi:hypothetical protein